MANGGDTGSLVAVVCHTIVRWDRFFSFVKGIVKIIINFFKESNLR